MKVDIGGPSDQRENDTRAYSVAPASEGRVLMSDRRNAGADLQRVNFDQLGPQLIEQRLITADQLAADRARLDSDAYAQPTPLMWTVAGRSAPQHAD